MWYMMRQFERPSTIRSSWHPVPTSGIGRDWGQSERFSTLQSAQQETGLNLGVGAKWRRLNLPPQPDERFVVGAHRRHRMSYLTYNQAQRNIACTRLGES